MTEVKKPLLSKREHQVLEHAARGLTAEETADTLFISKRTVDYHLTNIYAKLGVHNRVLAIQRGLRLGLLPRQEARWARATK